MVVSKIERFAKRSIEEIFTREVVQKMINKEEFRVNPLTLEISDIPEAIECEDVIYFVFGWHYENSKKDICYIVNHHPFYLSIDYDLLKDYETLIAAIKNK